MSNENKIYNNYSFVVLKQLIMTNTNFKLLFSL